MRVQALLSALASTAAADFHAFISQNGLEGMFKVTNAGVTSLENYNNALGDAWMNGYFTYHDALYSRAAMSGPLSETCDFQSLPSSLSQPTNDDLAYRTVLVAGSSGNACGTLIPDDAAYATRQNHFESHIYTKMVVKRRA